MEYCVDILYLILQFLDNKSILNFKLISKYHLYCLSSPYFYTLMLHRLFKNTKSNIIITLDIQFIVKYFYSNINRKVLWNNYTKIKNGSYHINTFRTNKTLKFYPEFTNDRFHYFEISDINISKTNMAIGISPIKFPNIENFVGYPDSFTGNPTYSYSSNGLIRDSSSNIDHILHTLDNDKKWQKDSIISFLLDLQKSILHFFKDGSHIYSCNINISNKNRYLPVVTMFDNHQSFKLSKSISVPIQDFIKYLD